MLHSMKRVFLGYRGTLILYLVRLSVSELREQLCVLKTLPVIGI